MRIFRCFPACFALFLSVALAVFPAAPAPAAPGDVDVNFLPGVSGSAFATAVLPDGKILVGGSFSGASGTGILLARLHADGTRDGAFNSNVSGLSGTSVDVVALPPDGRILVGGNFTTVGGSPRSQLARLFADGTLDSTFSPVLNDYVGAIAVQTDGKILIGGGFTSVNGSTRNLFARLNANGTLDTAFNPNPNDRVERIAVQTDGRILVGGWFHNIAGSARNYLVRLNADGTLDSAFNPNPSIYLETLAVQADGKILVGGSFNSIAGNPRSYLARLNASGTLDTAFNPNPNGSVNAVAVQADGRILLGGNFTTIGSTARNGLARLNANGTLDTTFTVASNLFPTSLTVQADGRVLVSGNVIAGLSRLLSDAATQSLTIPSANRVSWGRGGASPEIEQVSFELSTDGGNTYSALGAGTRLGGGWEKTGLSLPADGEIRVRGRTSSGIGNDCAGQVQSLTAFGTAAPEIAVEQPPGTDLADRGSVNWGGAGVGDGGSSLTFTIRNTGTASLTDLGVTIDGPDRAMFSLTARPIAPVPGGGGSTAFTVRFTPTSTGAKTAALHLANNDANENPFDLTLTGTGALSTNADLSALSASGGILTPTFTSATTSYAVAVGSATSSTAITSTTASTAATIRVNGVAAISGVPSAPFALNVGANLFTIVVTAGDGVSTKTYTITVTRSAQGFGIGDAEMGFAPSFDGTVSTTQLQPDGKILVGGRFTSIGGIPRNRLARFHADGTLDSGFDPNANNVVSALAVQADGKIVIGGGFTTIGGTTRNRLARLNADGTLDSGFNPDVNGLGLFSTQVSTLAVLPDGRLLVGGSFTTIGGVARYLFARLLANGALDSAFDANLASDGVNPATVNAVALQADGRILIGGYFTSVGGINRRLLARLNASGTLDSTYAPSPPSPIYAMVVQADGKAIVAGGQVFRFDTDGTRDAAFNPNVNSFVFSLAVEADGKVLLGGVFTNIGGSARNQLARLQADGTLDITFDPNVGGGGVGVSTLALQKDGRVLAGGAFTSVGSAARSGFARLVNDPATDSLTIPSAQRVQWLRGGTSPEAEAVSFELSTDVGATYGPLGSGTRIPGGWELTGLSLPAGGEIRARARAANGGVGSGLVETLAAFGNAVPEIVVEQPLGTDLVDGGSVSFVSLPAGEATSLTFTIRNPGTARLTGHGLTLDGADAAMFSITAAPAAMVPGAGGSTTFTIQFLPISTGAKTATLHLASNDPDENPFDLTLTGMATISSNPELLALSLSAGTLTPAFSSATTSYTAGVGFNAATITITPTARATAAVAVNGGAVPAGGTSGPMSLRVGANVVTIVVTAGDGVTTRTYSVTITRAPLAAGDVDFDFTANTDGAVTALAVQPDGRIVLGGEFTSVQGAARNRVARLRASGTVDPKFNPDANGRVNAALVQADGRIVLGGAFTSLRGATRNRLARVLADSALDATFGPNANNEILSVAVQADGRLVVAGNFTGFNSSARDFLARLDVSGVVDSAFYANPNTTVNSIAVQADGRLLVGGAFQYIASSSASRSRIARLFPNGAVEENFHPDANGTVLCVALQPDGRVLLGGAFTSVGGLARNRLARLNADGTLDTAFNPNADNSVSTIALQADGRVLVGGTFTSLGGTPRNRLARLLADGSLDTTFNPDASDAVQSLALQADGRVLVGGAFTSMGGLARSRFARLINDPSVQNLSAPTANRVAWMRSGSAPEIEQVSFELSTDGGVNWTPLGTGARLAGGWEKTGLSLPASGQLRARGRTVGGAGNGSSGVVGQVATFGASTRLEAWRLTYFGSPANSGDGADTNDFDGDGLANLLEFGTLRDPTAPSGPVGVFTREIVTAPPPAREILRFTYQRATAAVLDGIQFTVDRSTDLSGPWIANVPQEILFQDGTVQTVEAKYETLATQPLPPQHFMRLRVIRP